MDYELRGCPINKAQLLEVISAFLRGRAPAIAKESVCQECKRRGTVCVMVAHHVPCLGPVTHSGCGALCPAYGRGCYGCYGPVADANTQAMGAAWRAAGVPEADIRRVFRTFNPLSESFRQEAENHGEDTHD